MPIPRECPTCGKLFSAKFSDNEKFCSKRCYTISQSTTPARICEQCGASYVPDHGNRPSRFCSNKCQGLNKRSQQLVTCLHCGKVVSMPPHRIAGFRYCSHACRANHVSVGKYIGVRVHKDTPPKPYHRSYWVKQSGRARKRDGYQCQHCGKQFRKGTGELHAHHIKPIRLGGSDHLSNIISLCRSCHKKADDLIRAEG